MEKVQASLDVATYNILLDGLAKNSRIEEVVRVFDYMEGLKLVNSESFTITIRGLCHAKEMRKAMKLHDKMLDMGLKPDKAAYKRRQYMFEVLDGWSRELGFTNTKKRGLMKRFGFALGLHTLLPENGDIPNCLPPSPPLNLRPPLRHRRLRRPCHRTPLSPIPIQIWHYPLRRPVNLPFLNLHQTPRPYSLLIFFDAEQFHSKPELHLQDLYTQYSLVSSSFIANNDVSAASSLFFCDIEFKESQKSFSLFGVNSLPHIRLVGPNVKNMQDSEVMDQGGFSRMAESMAEFVESRTKLNVGPIHRPPIVSKNQIAFLVVTVLIWVRFFIKNVATKDTILHDWRVWLLGAVFVYFFSVSGGMFNIIRKMPLFLVDRNDPSKLVFFHQGSGMQLGGEGFAVGFLYTTVGLLLGVVTHVLVRVNNRSAQQVVMGAALVVSFWAVKKVVSLDNWKTGYGVHAFWPTSWR
ncbi:hypothetical protein OIU76_029026 [Salix suchowensis]|nr:hypothetical protein OIU76_029026 [Salix suchowensis]